MFHIDRVASSELFRLLSSDVGDAEQAQHSGDGNGTHFACQRQSSHNDTRADHARKYGWERLRAKPHVCQGSKRTHVCQ
jgi:hypothetical protein